MLNLTFQTSEEPIEQHVRSDEKQERLKFVFAPLKPTAGGVVACEQALLLGRAKRDARERTTERRSCEGPRGFRVSRSHASHTSSFHDIPQMEILLAG